MNKKQLKYVSDRTWQYFDTHDTMSKEKFEEILNVAKQVHKDVEETKKKGYIDPDMKQLKKDGHFFLDSGGDDKSRSIGEISFGEVSVSVLTDNKDIECAFIIDGSANVDIGINIIDLKPPEPHRKWSLEEDPCSQCKHEFPSISGRCKACCNTEHFDEFEAKTEPEKVYLDKSCGSCGDILYIADSITCSKCSRKHEKELIEDIRDDLEELIAWSKYLPVDSEIVIRLGRKQEKYEGMLKK